jgi:hypothetical protein
VAATFSTPIEPPSMALTKGERKTWSTQEPLPWNRSYDSSAVSRRRKLVTSDTTVAQNTDSTGEKPHIMKATIDTSDRKWNQYLRVSVHTESTCSKVVLPMPYLRASISTIRNSAR